MRNINWNKIIITVLLIVFGLPIYLYFILPGTSPIIWFTSLTLHLIASVLFTWNDYKKIYILIMAILLLINSMVAFVEFPKCDIYGKDEQIKSCECKGLIKVQILRTQCIGKRSECYEFINGKPENKTEISCAELDT